MSYNREQDFFAVNNFPNLFVIETDVASLFQLSNFQAPSHWVWRKQLPLKANAKRSSTGLTFFFSVSKFQGKID